MLNMVHEVVEAGIEPWASYRKGPPDELIPIFETRSVNVVVVGGSTNGQFSILMGTPMAPHFRADPTAPVMTPVDAWR